ncbi:MAG: type II secretion system inner membrane protein GspF [Magnetococcus sp. WYHC-3]
MAAFDYEALDARGRRRKGMLEADSPRQAREVLRERGLSPTALVESQRRGDTTRSGSGSTAASGVSWRGGGVKPAELSLATRQLATLVRCGLPLAEALSVAAQQTDTRRMKGALLSVRAKVSEGHTLASALGEHPRLFSDLYRETVAAGEQSGRLDQVLERLAEYLESGQELRQSVVLAMIYPLIVLIFSLLVAAGLLTYVVPQVVSVFQDFDQELPLLTRALIALSDFLRQFGPALLVLGGLGFLGLRMLLRVEGPRLVYHRILLHLPLVARLVRGLNTARFARTFGVMVASGVPVLEGLHIASRVVVSLPMRRVVEGAARKVREGGALARALEGGGYFSPLVVHLIASGEASGDLAGMLERAAETQEREVRTLVGVLSNLMEPLLILFMGGMVLTIVVAILLPVFDLNTLIK